jgi:hypothetical protein
VGKVLCTCSCSAAGVVVMNVDVNRGICVAAFHFDPVKYEELSSQFSGRDLFIKLAEVCEPIAGEILPAGPETGAWNIAKKLGEIQCAVTEAMMLHYRGTAVVLKQNA